SHLYLGFGRNMFSIKPGITFTASISRQRKTATLLASGSTDYQDFPKYTRQLQAASLLATCTSPGRVLFVCSFVAT
ncbi:hypothetical protein, partial [Klebsiella quasipneumoniae]|uniref:hypothetical protein n=1 Tax=Klebsiella quasipneumoniae TaxID=1463165 RepID=UPI0034D1F05C